VVSAVVVLVGGRIVLLVSDLAVRIVASSTVPS
jgi:hypothetical protein